MVVGFIEGHPLISIPNPHQAGDDHPGLAQFSGASIVPMLRFYSFAFRCFVIMSLAFLLILRPYIKFIKIHGKEAPARFRKKVGKINWDYRKKRSVQDFNDRDEDDNDHLYNWLHLKEMIFILDAIDTLF